MLPEIRTGVLISKMFYGNKTLRNVIVKKFGQTLSEAMTDVLMGDRTYPKDFKKTITRKLKGWISI
jgi:hypothetical protein